MNFVQNRSSHCSVRCKTRNVAKQYRFGRYGPASISILGKYVGVGTGCGIVQHISDKPLKRIKAVVAVVYVDDPGKGWWKEDDAQAGAISKFELSLSIFNSAICSLSVEKISAIGQALFSMPWLNGLTIFRRARVVMHVYHQISQTAQDSR